MGLDRCRDLEVVVFVFGLLLYTGFGIDSGKKVCFWIESLFWVMVL